MIRVAATVAERTCVSGDNCRLVFEAPAIARSARPGQFVEVATGGATLLNKPFSIAAVDPPRGEFTLVVKAIGPGTQAIAAYQPGHVVDVLGPLGNGFPPLTGNVIVVGGGIGIPPLLFLVARFESPDAATVMLGARTQDDLVLVHEFAALTGVPPVCTTDDGSAGRAGYVTDVLAEQLAEQPCPVCACGPVPMLTRVADLSAQADVPLYACLEAYMGCGTGICMGCAIPTVRGMERVCREGPVFLGRDVRWEELPGA